MLLIKPKDCAPQEVEQGTDDTSEAFLPSAQNSEVGKSLEPTQRNEDIIADSQRLISVEEMEASGYRWPPTITPSRRSKRLEEKKVGSTTNMVKLQAQP